MNHNNYLVLTIDGKDSTILELQMLFRFVGAGYCKPHVHVKYRYPCPRKPSNGTTVIEQEILKASALYHDTQIEQYYGCLNNSRCNHENWKMVAKVS